MGIYCTYPNLDEFNYFAEKQRSKLRKSLCKAFMGLLEEDVEDVIQDSLLVLWQKIQEREDKKLLPMDAYYLWGICRNKACDCLEDRSRFTPFLDSMEGEEDEAENFDRGKGLEEVLKNLPVKDQELLILYYCKGLSFREIALQMGYRNEDTAKSQKCRVLRNLRNYYRENHWQETA